MCQRSAATVNSVTFAGIAIAVVWVCCGCGAIKRAIRPPAWSFAEGRTNRHVDAILLSFLNHRNFNCGA